MKFRELPNQEAIIRLTAYAFVRDGADESVFKFHRSISPAYEFYNNQRSKIITRYGEKSDSGDYIVPEDKRAECVAELNALIESDIGFQIGELDLSEQDFHSGQCRKPTESSLLLSSAEKEAILRLSEIIRKENKIAKLSAIKNELEASSDT